MTKICELLQLIIMCTFILYVLMCTYTIILYGNRWLVQQESLQYNYGEFVLIFLLSTQ